MEETEIDQTQNFYISKMSNFTHYASGLRKFPTETTNLRFTRKFNINYNTNILDTVSQRCADSDFFESGSNPVLQILNPNPLRIRYQLDSRNPNLV